LIGQFYSERVEERRDERKAKGARSRQAILRAALATLADKGLEGFSARNVAERAGVSTATLFHHFASLDELQLEAMLLVLDDAMDARPIASEPDARHYLRALGDLALDMVREQPELMRVGSALFGKLPFSEPLQQSAAKHYTRYVDRIETELAGVNRGEAAAPSLRNMALALGLLLDGMANHWAIYHDVETLERFWTDMVALFAVHLEPQ